MMAAQNTLGIIVYAPALVDGDGRPLAIVQGLERALPGVRLEWTISDEGRVVPLPRREAWIAQGRPEGRGFPLLCNGDESALVTISGWETPGGQNPGGQPLFEVHAELPLDEAVIAAAVDMMEGVAEGARALWGHATPDGAALEIARQTTHPVYKLRVPPRGLPALKFPEDIPSPEIPQYLGWLNYWSAGAARAIGFPDSSRDADLLSRARRTASGGWVVRLTDAPLDLDIPTHLDALLRAYARFPEIGGCSTP